MNFFLGAGQDGKLLRDFEAAPGGGITVGVSQKRPTKTICRPHFVIQPATAADVSVILQLIRELADYERAPDDVVATEEGLREVLFGEKPSAEVLLAREEGEAVGFAVYFFNFSTWLGRPGLYLEDLFVRPAVRGKGYGRALLERLAQIARERGCGRMEWAVLDWNEPAIQFYKKLGAQPMEEWTTFRLTRDGIAALASTASLPEGDSAVGGN